jgi:hypothetical protein
MVNPEVNHRRKEKSYVSTAIKGHIKKHSKAWKKKKKNREEKDQEADDQNTTASASDEDVVVFSVGEEECFHVADPYVEWVIDLAAS